MVNLLMTLAITFMFICYVGASSIMTPTRRMERSLSCPRNIQMICPTGKKRFVVHSSFRWVGWLPGCEFDEPIMVTALRECKDDLVPEACKDKWAERPNNCSAPVFKGLVDYAFQGACFLHDLCYISLNTTQKDCDNWFLHNMEQMCSTWTLVTGACKSGAKKMYSAVNILGKIYFDKAKSWTRRNCTECPRNIQMICPTEKKYFVVHSSLHGMDCKFDEPIMVTALRECNNSIMGVCKDKWEKKSDNCSASVIKEVVDYAFQGACFLHDLCYLSWNTNQKDCDDWFLHNMKKMCSIQESTCPLCIVGANTVYFAVRKSGRSLRNFDEAKSWTKDNCIPESKPTEGPTSEGFGSD